MRSCVLIFRVKICANCSEIKHEVAVKQEMMESGAAGDPGAVGVNHLLELGGNSKGKAGLNSQLSKINSKNVSVSKFERLGALSKHGSKFSYGLATQAYDDWPPAAEKENGFGEDDDDDDFVIKREGGRGSKARKRKRGRPKRGEEGDSPSKAKKPKKSREEIQWH